MKNLANFISKNIIKICILLVSILTIIITYVVCSSYNNRKIIEVAQEQKLKTSLTTVPEGYIGISTSEELASINENLSGNYILMADIDMTGVEFDVIGKQSYPPYSFEGTFDGNNYKISNLKIEAENQYVGMFGYVGKGTIKNLTLENIYINNTITSNNYTGGLVGENYRGTITNTYVTGKVISENGYSDVGGLVGRNWGTGTITNSCATVTVTGSCAGGLVGENRGTITNTYSTGEVIGRTAGGLVGTNTFGTIDKSYSVGKVTGTETSSNVAGLTGYNGTITNSYYAIDTTKQLTGGGEGKTLYELLKSETYKNWDFNNIWKIEESHTLPYFKGMIKPETVDIVLLEGKGTEEEPYLIKNIEELQQKQYLNDVYYKLANDIDASEIENFEPIQGEFKGILDGNNHSINNLTIKSKEDNIGLFKENGGTIKNLKLNNLNIESNYIGDNSYIGGICAYNNGIIKGIEVNGRIKNIGTTQSLYIGQIVGYNNRQIIKTHSNGTIENIGSINNSYIGGIAGYNNSNILMSYNTGNVNINNVENLSYGGIAGKSNLIIKDCYSKGNVSINANNVTIGGISGENSGIIKNTYSTDVIQKQVQEEYLGGIVGKTNIEVISSYYDISNIEEQNKKGSKRTLEELKQQFTFENWNFEKIWSIEEKVNTPIFLEEIYNNDEEYIDEDYYGDDFWEWHTRTTTNDKAYNGKHIIINHGESIDFYGYGVTSYKDYLYKNYSNAGQKTFMFKIDETQANYHTLDGAGFIFNSKKEDNLLSGYILLIKENDISIYRLDNVNASTFETAPNSKVATYGTLVASVPKNSSTIHNLIVKTSPTNVNVIDNGEEMLNVELDYSKHSGEDFGLIASYEQHDCSILSKIKFMQFIVEVNDYKIPIIKTDEFGNRLSGAKFQLKNENGETLNEGITNENGVLEFKCLQEGIYTLEEIEAPSKHIFKNNTITFKLTNDGKIVNIETGEEIAIKVINEKLKFVIKVLDTDENPIQNSKVSLYDKDGNIVLGSNGQPIIVTTGSDGTATITDIEDGTYTFKQIETPKDYILNETIYEVKVDKNGDVTFKDSNKGTIYNNKVTMTEEITIYKYRINSMTALSGAVIGVFDSEENKVREGTTNTKGEVTFGGLEVGSYYYQEIEAPVGYVLNDTKYRFTVYNDGSVDFSSNESRIIWNNPVIMEEAITITKKEKGSDKLLEGAVIGIFDIKGNKIKEGTTNKNGAISFNGLEVGEYYYKEIKAPEGYRLNDTEYHFTVENNGRITLADGTTKVIYNDKINININVTKVWEDNSNSAGKRPESVIIVAKSGEIELGQVELTVANAQEGNTNTWIGQIENLPKYDSNGNEIIYTIDEKEVNVGDLSFYTKNVNQETKTVTNTINYSTIKTNITVRKVWNDNNNIARKRPENVTIKVKNGNKEVSQLELTLGNAIEENNNIWEGQVTNLPKYDTEGNEIRYTLEELNVNKFYVSKIEGNTITNTFTVLDEKVNLAVTKVWEDNSNSAGKRPESIIVVAKSGKNEIGQVELTVANAQEGNTNTWIGQIENLPKYDSNGNEIVYTIDEKEVNVGDLNFYTKTINQETKTVINTLKLVKTRYKVEHYLRTIDQEVEGYNYEEEYFEAYAGDFVTAVPKEYEGFVENTLHPNRIPSGVVLEDGTLVLKLYYNREQYTIEYVLNGGKAIGKLIGGYIYGTEIYLSRRVEKEGYEFVGWYDNEKFEGDIITKIEKGEKGNKVLYAKWKPKQLDSETYQINETKKQISQVNPLTTVEKFLSNLNITGNTKVYDLEGNEVSKDKLVGTGYVVKLEDGNEYQIAVKGDLDGNGRVSITDLSMMNQAIIGNKKLSEIVKVAADMDGNEKLTITDLSMINQYLLKK